MPISILSVCAPKKQTQAKNFYAVSNKRSGKNNITHKNTKITQGEKAHSAKDKQKRAFTRCFYNEFWGETPTHVNIRHLNQL
jgi:hypothetical protein